MTVEGSVSPSLLKIGSHYPADIGSFGHTRNLVDYILPGFTAISGDLEIAVIGPYIEQTLLDGGLRNSDHRSIEGNPIVSGEGFFIHQHAHNGQLIPVGPGGEVGACRPCLPPIGRFEQPIAAVIDSAWIMRRDKHRAVPVELIAPFPLLRHRSYRPLLSCLRIEAEEVAVLGFGVDDSRVGGVYLDIEPVSAPYPEPFVIGNSLAIHGSAGTSPAPVVLQAAVNVIGLPHIHADLVELSQGQGVDKVPGFAPVVGEMNPTIRAHNHMVGVSWINPHSVVVAVDAGNHIGAEGYPPILRSIHSSAKHPYPLVVIRVDPDLAVIHGARIGAAHLLPAQTLILRPENTSIFIFNNSVDNVGVLAVNEDADASRITGGQPVGELGPDLPSIGGLVETAVGTTPAEPISGPPSLVSRRIDSVRAGEVYSHIHKTGVLVDKQGVHPGLTPIGGLVQTPFLIGTPQMPHSSHIDNVGIGGMDGNATDVMAILESHIGPGVTAIGRFVDPIAPGGALPVVGLAGAHPYDTGVRRGYGYRSNGAGILVVKDRLPGDPVVGGLPQTAGGSARIDDPGLALHYGKIVYPPTHNSWSYASPLEILQKFFVDLSRTLTVGTADQECQSHDEKGYYCKPILTP